MSTLHYVTSIIVVIAVLTAGSALLMWIGESITENGVGNGISIVLLINIISGMPSDFATLYNTFVASKTIARGVAFYRTAKDESLYSIHRRLQAEDQWADSLPIFR